MTLKTVAVTVRAQDAGGNVMPGAKITAKLSGPDVDATYGHVIPKDITAEADATGAAILQLWPNELGSCQTFYYVSITGTNGKTVKVEATIPDAACNLWTVANLPPYDGKSDGQLAIDAAVAAVAPAQAAQLAAETAAGAAAGSATAAAGSATAAAGSATTASNKAADANTSAVGASQSATNAATSATAAAGSATAAATSKTGADTAKAGAEAAATNAATSATGAAGSATAAGTSATAAAGSATAAANSATTATNKANEAATSATAAEGSAATASTKAGEAAASASAALASKTSADDAATLASQKATAAAGSAQSASDTISAFNAALPGQAAAAVNTALTPYQITSAADAARASVSAGQAAASAVTAAAAAAGAAAIVTGVATGRPSIRPSLILAFDRNGRFDPRVVVARTGTVPGTDINAKLATFLANVPRVTYDPSTMLCMGYLIEPSATNITLRSEELDNAQWAKVGATISANAIAAPDGAITMDKIVEDSSSGAHYVDQGCNVVAGNSYAFSVFLRKGERTQVELRLTAFALWGSAGVAPQAVIDLVSGTVVSSANCAAGIQDIGNGRYRAWIIAACTASGVSSTRVTLSNGGLTYAGDGVSGAYAWGVMCEAVAANCRWPTSYIATTSAQVTRAAESNLFNPLFPGFSTSQGTAYIRGITRGTGSGNQNLAKFSDGTANNVIEVFRNSARQICLRVTVAGVVQGYVTGVAIDDHAAFELAASWTTAGFRLTVNNKAPMTLATSGNLVPTVNRLSLGENCYLKNFSFFPKQLNLAEEIVLTANTTGFGTAPGTSLLESVAVPSVGAWGLRRLTAGYTGNLVDVVRSSDGASASIGMKADGTLDEFALMNHLGAENLVTFSEQLDQWPTVQATTTANAATAPDGSFTADKLVESATSSTHNYAKAVAGLMDNTIYTFSAYLKAGERNYVALSIFNKSGSNKGTYFNLSNGTMGLNTGGGAPLANYIIPVGNGWYRCSVSVDIASGFSAPEVRVFLGDASSSGVYTGDGTSGAYVWGAQLHAGTQLLDYCRTTSAATTSGQNLLTFSENFDHSNWPSKTASSIMRDVAVSPDGTMSADKLVEDASATTVHYVARSYTAAAAGSMTLSVFAKAGERTKFVIAATTDQYAAGFDLAAGTVFAQAYTSNQGVGTISSVGNGWYRCTMTWPATVANNALRFLLYTSGPSYTGDGASGLYLWGAQLNQGPVALPYKPSTLTFTGRSSAKSVFDSTGTLASVASGVQAVEYDSVACYPNLLAAPEMFDTGSFWTLTNATLASAATTAPNGQTTAYSMTGSAGTLLKRVRQSVSNVAAGTVTFSIHVKAGTEDSCALTVQDNTATNGATATFNLVSGSVVSAASAFGSATGAASSIYPVGNGWYRLAVTCALPASGTMQAILTMDVNGNSATTGTLYMWGAKLEYGAVPTIYDNQSLVQQNLVLNSALASGSNWTQQLTGAPSAAISGGAFVLAGAAGERAYYVQTVTLDVGTYTASASLDAVSGSMGRSITVVNGTGSATIVVTATDNPSATGQQACTFQVTTAGTIFVRYGIGTTGGLAGAASATISKPQLNAGNSALPYRATTTTAYTQFIQKGPVYEAASTNYVRNNTMVGAAAGAPGTLPTGWPATYFAPTGVTRSIVQTVTAQGVPCIEMNFSGTPSSSGEISFYFENIANLLFAAGTTVSTSLFLAIVGGSTANVTGIYMRSLSYNGSTYISEGTSQNYLPQLSQQLTRFRLDGYQTAAGSDRIIPCVSLYAVAGQAINITLRIGAPMLEQASSSSSVILTSNATVTRAADSVTATALEAGSGYISKVYDQSGHGRDLVQATAAARPRLALAGKIDRMYTAENLFLNSAAPVTQTVTLAVGTYTLGIVGSGSIAAAAGTAVGSGFGSATAGVPKTFTVSTAGTVTLTKTGTVTQAQLNTGSNLRAYVATTGTAIALGDPHANNKPQFVTDGAAQSLASASFSVAQPLTRSSVIQINALPAASAIIMDSTAAPQAAMYLNSVANIGNFIGAGGNVYKSGNAVNDAMTIVESMNGASSSGSVNGNVASTTSAGSNGTNGIRVGAVTTGNGQYFAGGFGEVILLANVVSTSDRQAIEANQKSFYNIA